MILQNFFLNAFLIAFITAAEAETTCPPLPTVSVGVYVPATCDASPSPQVTVCTLICPSGYHISHGPVDMVSDTRECLSDGTWEYRETTPSCKDYQPPTLTCPDGAMEVANDPGKSTATVTWNFAFTDNSLMENEPGITEDSFQVVVEINGLQVDESLPKMLSIGVNTVKYVVTDPAGNAATCIFIVEVKDQEPPVVTDCPDDIIIDDVTTSEIRVNWQRPTATDNSGEQPQLTSNIPSGDLFAVPGSYEIQYTAKDGAGNVATTCSFRVTLARKTCTLYAAPKNGALACFTADPNSPVCAVMCKSGFDFVSNPSMLYFCSNGEWIFFSWLPSTQQVPWPDCSATPESPSSLASRPVSDYYYFDANDANVQDAIKTKFIELNTKSGLVPPFLCYPECTSDNIITYIST